MGRAPFVGAAFEEGRQTFSSQWAFALDGVTRLVAVALMVGLGWIVFRGPRQRTVGALMLVIGGYFALIPSRPSFAVLTNTEISLPPLAFEAYQYPYLLLWTSAAVAVLGLVELFWPTPSQAHPRERPLEFFFFFFFFFFIKKKKKKKKKNMQQALMRVHVVR